MEFEKIQSIIAEQLGVDKDKITAETSLSNDLGADSLDIFQIISEIEEEFGMEFDSDSAERLKTVDDVIKYIKKLA